MAASNTPPLGSASGATSKSVRILRYALLLAGIVVVALLIFKPQTSDAAIKTGTSAPNFVTQGAIGGKTFTLDLSKQLKKGPVVLYFFPKAFTKGCTLETQAFADNHDKFSAAGATVIGLSADDLPTLQRFSTEACRSKFPVAIATPAIIKAYDVKMPAVNMTNRTSFVIGSNGRIAYVHSDLNYIDHVKNTLAAVQALKK